MNTALYGIGAITLVIAGAAGAHDADWFQDQQAVIVTASNTASNELLIYGSDGTLIKTLPTQGQGGASGNAGGIAQNHDRLAVVNFGSTNVSVFFKDAERARLSFSQTVPALASPVSVAFGKDHLYILTTTHVESHRMDRDGVSKIADGSAALLVGDGSAAQVGVLPHELVFSEKSNAIETVRLDETGAIAGNAGMAANIPSNVNAPFGLATRGNDAYVTIAHANEISLVRHDAVLTVTGSGTQSAPCWLALDGPFLFSSNSPSETVSRYAVYGKKIIQDAAVVAKFNGDPTDIAYRNGMAAVVDSNGTLSHVSSFAVDEDGNFTLKGVATIDSPAANGIAIVVFEENFY